MNKNIFELCLNCGQLCILSNGLCFRCEREMYKSRALDPFQLPMYFENIMPLGIETKNNRVYSQSSFMSHCPRCCRMMPMTEIEKICCKCKREEIETDELFYKRKTEELEGWHIRNNISINHNDM